MPFALALSRKRASSAMAIASAKPMPTKPLVAIVSPERIRLTASRADVIFPSTLQAGARRPGTAVRSMDRLCEKGKHQQRLGTNARGQMRGFECGGISAVHARAV